MQLIQIADFHFKDDIDSAQVKNKIDKMFASLQGSLSKKEQIVICLLGDIVDCGKSDYYKIAKKYIDYLLEKFVEYTTVSIECVPGNHDLCGCTLRKKIVECDKKQCSLDSFNEFAKSINAKSCFGEATFISEYDDAILVSANSVVKKKCKYGAIDLEAVKSKKFNKNILLLTHHTFLSENHDDVSAIRNGYDVFNFVDEAHVIGVLHGHTHGYKDIVVGKQCRLIGVGPFLKNVDNVNNQFNLIHIDKRGIVNIKNYFYREDLKEYKVYNVFSRGDLSLYQGHDISTIYTSIVEETIRSGLISNLVLKIEMPVDEFNGQIERLFPMQIKVAEDWQQESAPDNLYYNHGSYMRYKDIKGIDFVVDELNSKPTSSRAIIPLINFENVYVSGDGFLPSFDVVQFGFNSESKDTLYITVYLRALEVNHFLKINLCEIYVMCKNIRSKIRGVENINVTVVAFRAQYKENFGCFAKAGIDIKSESDLLLLLQDENIDEICRLLTEKINFNETVVKSEGIKSLYSALVALNKRRRIKDDILNSFDTVMREMELLKEELLKTSNYAAICATERVVQDAFANLINSLKKGLFYDA